MPKPWEAAPFWRFWLLPLSWLYAGAQGLAWYWRRRHPPLRVKAPVISVGNLSVGGTGKSPLVRAIAQRYRSRPSAILLRGYGAKPGLRPLKVARAMPWQQGGDEALEHARRTLAPVWIGADRNAAALAALAAGARLLVLDDGFQRRWQLDRDLDLVCADFSQVQAGQALLPAGPWREPWKALADATAVLISGAPRGLRGKALAKALPSAWASKPLFRLDSQPKRLQPWPGGKPLPLSWLKGRAITAFSGLGQPQRFEADLQALGAKAKAARFGDHHAFSRAELQALAAQGRPLVCTYKDALRLDPAWRLAVPVLALEAEALIDPAPVFWSLVDQALKKRKA